MRITALSLQLFCESKTVPKKMLYFKNHLACPVTSLRGLSF